MRTVGYGPRVNRWDETWHRLLEWTNGSTAAERLAGVVLSQEYRDLDPVHPLGGPDDRSDATALRDGRKWSIAVYFPRGPQPFRMTRAKFMHDLPGVAASGATGMVFFTNQEVTRTQREELRQAGGGVYLTPAIRSMYYGRQTVGALARQYRRYGRSKVKTLAAHPGSLRPRQLAAPLLVAALALGGPLALINRPVRLLFGLFVFAYGLADLLASLHAASRSG